MSMWFFHVLVGVFIGIGLSYIQRVLAALFSVKDSKDLWTDSAKTLGPERDDIYRDKDGKPITRPKGPIPKGPKD